MGKYCADFHLHLDGSLMVKIIDELLELPENELLKLPENTNNSLKDKWKSYTEEEKIAYLSVPNDCENLDDYLKCFDLPCGLLQTRKAICLATNMLVKELANQGLTYANLRFAPQLHSKRIFDVNNNKLEHERGIVKSAIKGAKDAIKELKKEGKKIKVNFILCCMRNKHWGKNEDKANERTIEIAKELYAETPDCGVIGVDLAGGEYGNLNEDYNYIINQRGDVPLIIHSGESGATNIEKLNNIRYAIEHGAEFIGHATALECAFFEDNSPEKEEALELIRLIKEKGIFIEVCLTSNMQTKAVNGGIYNHPFAKLLEKRS